MIVTEKHAYDQTLSLDRAAYPLWKQAVHARVSEIMKIEPVMQQLKDFAKRVGHEVGSRLQKQWKIQHIRRAVTEPMVEKFLNDRALDLEVADPARISFLIQDLGGYGDLIFGVKALKVLKSRFLKTSFHMVTSGVDKLKKVLDQVALDCPISKIERRGFNPSFDLATQRQLETSDVVFVSPTGCFFTPPKVVKEKRDITLIEYNRPDYGLDISRRLYVTGIGDQASGVFIEPPFKAAEREESLAALNNRSLATFIHALDPQNNNPLYFAYGHNDVERFLSVLLNYETHNGIILTPYFSEEQLLLPAKATVIVHKPANFLDVLEAFRKQGAPIDIPKAAQSRQELLKHLKSCGSFEEREIQKMVRKIDHIIAEAEQTPPQKNQKAFTQSLTDGYCEIGEEWFKNEILTQAPGGNVLHLIVFNGLSFDDTKRIKSVADEICLSTGDQSFSEDLEKLMMYDTRKIEPILALADVAKKNGLHHIAQYFLAFSEKRDIHQTVACLQKRGKLREEMDVLHKIVRKEMDLAPQLIGLVNRQIRGQLDASRVHEAFVSYVLHPTDETLINIQAEISELEKRK